jgi:hypothetical protein
MSHTRSVRSAAAEARRRCRPLSASHLIGAKAPEKKNYKKIASKWVKNSVIIVSKMNFKKVFTYKTLPHPCAQPACAAAFPCTLSTPSASYRWSMTQHTHLPEKSRHH